MQAVIVGILGFGTCPFLEPLNELSLLHVSVKMDLLFLAP